MDNIDEDQLESTRQRFKSWIEAVKKFLLNVIYDFKHHAHTTYTIIHIYFALFYGTTERIYTTFISTKYKIILLIFLKNEIFFLQKLKEYSTKNIWFKNTNKVNLFSDYK